MDPGFDGGLSERRDVCPDHGDVVVVEVDEAPLVEEDLQTPSDDGRVPVTVLDEVTRGRVHGEGEVAYHTPRVPVVPDQPPS